MSKLRDLLIHVREKPASKVINPLLKDYFQEGVLLDIVDNDLSTIEPVRNAAGKVSAKLTIDNIPKDTPNDLKVKTLIISEVHTRSALYAGDNSLAIVVPPLMMALKKYQGILYSEWSTEEIDKPHLAFGQDFWEILKHGKAIDLSKYNMEDEAKKLITSSANKPISYALKVWPGVPKLPNKVFWRAIISHMMCQTWVLHPELRTEYMIMDFNDFDLMPEPLLPPDPNINDIIAKKPKTRKPYTKMETNEFPYDMTGSEYEF